MRRYLAGMLPLKTLFPLGGVAAAIWLAGCGDGPSPSDATPRFNPPVQIGAPVSTPGWEDSGLISPDGDTLYFTYLRIDPIVFATQGQIRLSGPLRPGWPTQPPFDTLGAELYRSTRVGGVWTEPQNLGSTLNLPEELEGDEWVSADGNRILFTNGTASGPRGAQGIYYAERLSGVWQTPVLASAVGYPFDSADENPHLTLDESTLFFESSRAGGLGAQDIWMSTRSGGTWTAPVNLGPTINTSGIEGSPFSLDGTELYFDDKGGGKGVSWSRLETSGQWRQSEVVLPGIFGDPSLTLAGDLYAIGARTVPGGYDADVYLARRR